MSLNVLIIVLSNFIKQLLLANLDLIKAHVWFLIVLGHIKVVFLPSALHKIKIKHQLEMETLGITCLSNLV